ncbi:BQ2448_3340 [Microbotryum intermedium]|uniref:BQ2448_3340 protein n=1 Tax=Microbotryum intermedium TaxID=269621 RepID=A0A238FHE8_9BASI|nr:BQ2448_3340 [Microbotryum intermedium]
MGPHFFDKLDVDKKSGSPQAELTLDYPRPVMFTIGWQVHQGSEDSVMTQYQRQHLHRLPNSKFLRCNTDGVHIYKSDCVTLLDWNVNNVPDDCGSVKSSATNVEIGSMGCNGLHRVSIGSLLWADTDGTATVHYYAEHPSKMTVSDVPYIRVTGRLERQAEEVGCGTRQFIGQHCRWNPFDFPQLQDPIYSCRIVVSEKQAVRKNQLDFHCTPVH